MRSFPENYSRRKTQEIEIKKEGRVLEFDFGNEGVGIDIDLTEHIVLKPDGHKSYEIVKWEER